MSRTAPSKASRRSVSQIKLEFEQMQEQQRARRAPRAARKSISSAAAPPALAKQPSEEAAENAPTLSVRDRYRSALQTLEASQVQPPDTAVQPLVTPNNIRPKSALKQDSSIKVTRTQSAKAPKEYSDVVLAAAIASGLNPALTRKSSISTPSPTSKQIPPSTTASTVRRTSRQSVGPSSLPSRPAVATPERRASRQSVGGRLAALNTTSNKTNSKVPLKEHPMRLSRRSVSTLDTLRPLGNGFDDMNSSSPLASSAFVPVISKRKSVNDTVLHTTDTTTTDSRGVPLRKPPSLSRRSVSSLSTLPKALDQIEHSSAQGAPLSIFDKYSRMLDLFPEFPDPLPDDNTANSYRSETVPTSSSRSSVLSDESFGGKLRDSSCMTPPLPAAGTTPLVKLRPLSEVYSDHDKAQSTQNSQANNNANSSRQTPPLTDHSTALVSTTRSDSTPNKGSYALYKQQQLSAGVLDSVTLKLPPPPTPEPLVALNQNAALALKQWKREKFERSKLRPPPQRSFVVRMLTLGLCDETLD